MTPTRAPSDPTRPRRDETIADQLDRAGAAMGGSPLLARAASLIRAQAEDLDRLRRLAPPARGYW